MPTSTSIPIPPHREISLFVSYARVDQDLVQRLLHCLKPLFATLRGYRVHPWIDHRIEPGVPWDPAIQAALDEADLGLALLSPAFLASAYIARVETPTFVAFGPGSAGAGERGAAPAVRVLRPILPVLLKDLPEPGVLAPHGFEQLQIFRDRDGRSFQRTRGHTRDAFANALATALQRKLERLFPPAAA